MGEEVYKDLSVLKHQRPQCGEAIYKDLSDSEVRTTTKIVTEYEVRVKLGIHENQVISRIF